MKMQSMLAIRGVNSSIARSLLTLLPEGAACIDIKRGIKPELLAADRFFFAQGYLSGVKITNVSVEESAEIWEINAAQIMRWCDRLIEVNPDARIVVMGSESAFGWSYDGAYAGAKAALHRYVETKKLRHPEQQLVCIAPGIIADAGMTLRREDTGALLVRAAQHPKGRWVTSLEVARAVYHYLYVDEGYTSGVVIRMNGGAHTCR